MVGWQLISILTGTVNQVLTDRPQYDLRNLMGDTAKTLLSDVLDHCDRCVNL